MSFAKIKNLLKENIGLHSGSIGDSSIERAISHRMSDIDIESEDQYFSLLNNCSENGSELHELIEEIVVPETWFFRNMIPFKALVESLLETRLKGVNSNSVLQILSLPCSTGEEPYSIAIALHEAGLNADEFRIEAIDISKKALKKARRALYGKHSFREDTSGYKDKYFKRTRSRFQLLSSIKSCVVFKQANIIKDPLGFQQNYYDVIFCRNLLIYFDRPTQKLVLRKLQSRLKPGGLLFVGHAETSQIGLNNFIPLDIPRSFAFRKKLNSITDIIPVRKTVQPVEKLKSIYDQLVEVTKKDIELARKRHIGKKYSSEELDSAQIKIWNKVDILLEKGRLVEAEKQCDELLKIAPESAQGFYFFGLIRKLDGRFNEAESFLKKAIYLDSNHHRAIGLYAWIAEKRGDEELAVRLRERQSRAKNRQDNTE